MPGSDVLAGRRYRAARLQAFGQPIPGGFRISARWTQRRGTLVGVVLPNGQGIGGDGVRYGQ
jgi:hypothetical protein